MEIRTIMSKREPREITISVRGPEDCREAILRQVADAIQKHNRRCQSNGGRRVGYLVEYKSSSSS